MHELSLCEGIRRIVLDQAHAHDATRVSRVRVEIGRFAGVEKDALAFAFDVVMKGTVAENAELVMLDLPGRAHCFDCGQEVTLDHRLDPCPVCGGGRVMPTGGDELRVKDLEVM